MPTVFDYDSFMRQRLAGSIGKVARHKLLYGVLRLSIATTGKPAFEARVEAWPLGPVFVELQKHPDIAGNPNALSSEDRRLCTTVLAKIGNLSGKALAVRSHRRYPEWRAAREGLKPTECGHCEITKEAIRRVTFNQARIEGNNLVILAKSDPTLVHRQCVDLLTSC